MAADKLLVAVDESEGSKKALDLAASLAKTNPQAHLDLVYVVPIPVLDESQMVTFQEILDMMIADGEELLEQLIDSCDEDVAEKCGSLLLTGTNPATEILKLLEQRPYDLVVVGSRGLSGIKGYLGSVSHKVLNGAKIPILIAK